MSDFPTITLISDWQDKGFYAAALKGKILNKIQGVNIVDITHNIASFSNVQAAYVLKNCYTLYPENTIHIIAVGAECSANNPFVVVKNENHFFIAADNGVFSLLFEKFPDYAVKLEVNEALYNDSFPELNVFAEAAIYIANGGNIENMGESVSELFRQVQLAPAYDESVINGKVIFIDSYFNVITNISKDLFDTIGKNRSFEIFIQSNYYKINKISKKYNEVANGEILALFNSSGLLEIAIKNGPVAELLNLDNKSNIRIKFYDS